MNIREVIIKDFFQISFRTYERNVGCDLRLSIIVGHVCVSFGSFSAWMDISI